MPARGATFVLVIISVLKFSFQSVSAAISGVPIINSVLVRATIPVTIMKIMSMKMKMTPIEPTFMKMLKSFLLQMNDRATNSAREQ